MRRFALLFACLLARACATGPAFAEEPHCFPINDVERGLSEAAGEHPVFAGALDHSDSLIVVFVSESGSFTLVRLRPDGTACPAGSGEGWHTLAKVSPVEKGS
jgi:hypothetical protein